MALWVRCVAIVGLLSAPLLALAAMMVADAELSVFTRSFGPLTVLFSHPIGLYVPSIALSVVMAALLSRGARDTWWVRATVVAVGAQLTVIGFGALLWAFVRSQIDLESHLPLAASIPVVPMFAAAVAVLLTAALPPRRALPFVRGAVVFVLAQMLVLGLMLPFVTRWLPMAWDAYTPAYPITLVGLSIAGAFALTGARGRAVWSDRTRRRLQIGFAGILVAAILVTPGPSHPGSFAYSNLIYLLLGEAVIALAGVVSFAVLQWRWLRARRSGGDTFEGVAQADDGDVVGWIRYRGWMNGMRAESARFRVRGKQGLVEVPAGARIVAATPPDTAALARGERAAAIRSGERVVVAGLERNTAEAPYRGAMVAGSRGVTVWRAAPERVSLFREVALWVWRPCLLYLAVTTAVALPGVVTAATPYDSDRVKYVFVHEPVEWEPEEAGALVRHGFMAGECAARASRPRVMPDPTMPNSALAREYNAAATCWGLRRSGCPSAWDLAPYTNFGTPFVPGADAVEILCDQVPPRRLEARVRGSQFRYGAPVPRGWDAEDWLSDEEVEERRARRWNTFDRALSIMRAYEAWTGDHRDACPASAAALEPYHADSRLPVDAWGNAFAIRCGPEVDDYYDFIAVSRGRDGLFDTRDDVERGARDPRERFLAD